MFTSRSATVATEQQSTAFPPGTFGSKLEHYETNYYDYLEEARNQLESCAKASQSWAYPYDGQTPSMDALMDSVSESDSTRTTSLTDTGLCYGGANSRLVEDLSGSDGGPLARSSEVDDVFISDNSYQSSVPDLSYILRNIDSDSDISSAGGLEDFIHYLDEVPTPPELEKTFEESLSSLDSVLSSLCSKTGSDSMNLTNNSDSIDPSITEENHGESVKAKVDGTTFEVINSVIEGEEVKLSQDTTSFVEISMSNFASDVNVQTALSAMPKRVSVNSVDAVVQRKTSLDESGAKSVSFNLVDSSMQNNTTVPAVSNVGKLAPNIGMYIASIGFDMKSVFWKIYMGNHHTSSLVDCLFFFSESDMVKICKI
jgi:hypothetical protein